METSEGGLIIKIKVKSERYFENMPVEFDMEKISDRLNYEIYNRRIPKTKLAREMGVSKDLVYSYTGGNFPEESMQISVLKSFAAFFNKDAYYFCNDYLKFVDTVDAAKLLKRIRQDKGITQRKFASELNITLAKYKSYENGKSRMPYLVYCRLQKLYGVLDDETGL